MATKELKVRVKHAYLSADEWVNKNPILQAGEFGIENDTQKFKIGDGVTKWSNLPYVSGADSDSGIVVDTVLSNISTNPVQNKVIKEALDKKLDKKGTADKAMSDDAGNNIVDTYAKKSDVNTALDKKANKATTLSGYGITDAKISDGTITLGSNTITPLTNHQSLANYYTKSSVDTLIANLKAGLVNVVDSLPTTGENGKLYLVKTGSESENLYSEYVYVNKAWEKLGTQKLDLSGYLTKTDAANTYLGKTAAAASANKLNTNGGSATQPIYFANGVPVATTYTLGKSVPSDAKFTDTVYKHPSTHPASMITGLSTVATSGSYNDLTNKPTIPSAYTLPNATSSTLGGVKIGSNISVSSGTISITKSNVTRALGYTPPTSDTVYDNATATTAGLMSASDKVKLNNIADNANNYIHPPTHPASMITGLASVATSGSYSDLSNKPTIPVVPTKVSAFINDAGYLTQHQSLDDYASKADVSALMSTKLGVTDTAYAATRDGAGNNIADTYAKKTDISGFVKTVNGTAPDTNGNVSITVSGGGGVSTSESNTWTGKQTFQKMKFNFESYSAFRVSGTIDTPPESVAVYDVQGNFTLNMSVLAGLLSNSEATLFTAYITANNNYTLTITNAGTLKYVGNASDLAITVNGLLLNILLIKSSSGDLSSVVQASALS